MIARALAVVILFAIGVLAMSNVGQMGSTAICPRCFGKGSLDDRASFGLPPRGCPKCHGRGWITDEQR